MKLRYKLLTLLLCASLAPILLLRLNAQRSMTALGDELSSRVAAMLISDAQKRLMQLSEMHAGLLARERRALELAIAFQAAEASRVFSSPAVPEAATAPHILPSAPGMGMGMGMGRGMSAAEHEHEPVQFFENEPSFKFAPGASPGNPDSIDRLNALSPSYRTISKDFSGVILWQATGLESGLTGFYPGPKSIPPGYDVRRSHWYSKALENGGTYWSQPMLDLATGLMALTVSLPVLSESGAPIGVTAIAVSLEAMFGHESLLRHISQSAEAFLVTVVARRDGSKGLSIRARRHAPRNMRPSASFEQSDDEELLVSDDAKSLAKIIADVENGASGILLAKREGEDAIWSYSPAWDGSALMIVAPVADVLSEAVKSGDYVHERIQEQMYYTGAIGLAAMGLITLLAFFGSRTVTKPLASLTAAARRLANGDFSARVPVRGKDEIAELGRIFNEAAPQLLERSRMRESLELAMEVQKSLLPAKAPRVPGLDAAAISIYCDETGGDYYDFFTFKGDLSGHLGAAVGDVTGHGVGAALLMTTARALLRPLARQGLSPAAIASGVNRELSADTEGTGRFMTLFYAHIDPLAREIVWARAGHDPAMLFAPDGAVTELVGQGLTLGVMEDAVYAEQRIKGVAEGSVLLIGSDGVWETRDPSGEMFGKDRARQAVKAALSGSAHDILIAVTDALDAFRGKAPAEDDVTLLVVKFLPLA